MIILSLFILLLISVIVTGTVETRRLGTYWNDKFHSASTSSQADCPTQLSLRYDDDEEEMIYFVCDEDRLLSVNWNDEFRPDDGMQSLELHFGNEVCFYCPQEERFKHVKN